MQKTVSLTKPVNLTKRERFSDRMSEETQTWLTRLLKSNGKHRG